LAAQVQQLEGQLPQVRRQTDCRLPALRLLSEEWPRAAALRRMDQQRQASRQAELRREQSEWLPAHPRMDCRGSLEALLLEVLQPVELLELPVGSRSADRQTASRSLAASQQVQLVLSLQAASRLADRQTVNRLPVELPVVLQLAVLHRMDRQASRLEVRQPVG